MMPLPELSEDLIKRYLQGDRDLSRTFETPSVLSTLSKNCEENIFQKTPGLQGCASIGI